MLSGLQLSEAELQMMNEVFLVFSKYKDKTRQFGLQLIHSHFPINEEEILYETHDATKRLLITRPVNVNEVENALATAWQINENGEINVSSFCCDGPPPPPPPYKKNKGL